MELALRTAIILAVAWMMARLLARATAATRHLIWHLAVIAVLAAPVLAPLAPEFRVPKVPGVPQVPEVLMVPGVPGSAGVLGINILAAQERGTLGTPSTPGTLGTLGTVGTLIWATGSVALALWFVLGWLATAASARRARPAPASWQVEVDRLRARLHITREVTVRVVAKDVSPIVAGLWRTTILIPDTARGWSADRRRSVLLHELAHIRRGDLHVEALAQAARSLYWFNPLVWIASAQLRSERERACDDEVLRSGAQPSTYASHLLDIARELRPALRLSAALAMARPSDLEGRLFAVLATGRARVPARATRWVIAATVIAITAGALGATPETTIDVAAAPPAVTKQSPREFRISAEEGPTPTERLGARRATRPLEAALADSDQDVREKAALGLAFMSSPDAIPGLLTALADPDSQVREKAAIGLALRRDARVVDALVAAVDDPDAQVREKVAIALGTSGDARADAALQRLLQDPDAQVREKAVTGLILRRATPDSLQR